MFLARVTGQHQDLDHRTDTPRLPRRGGSGSGYRALEVDARGRLDAATCEQARHSPDLDRADRSFVQ